jgi:hypothetical protein|tara:strand:- start:252 stop:377 length:126 start_codon:yes stop_codon:yes gene_type:complete
MTALEGFMMFLFSMAAFFTLAICAWIVIQEVLSDKKEEDIE